MTECKEIPTELDEAKELVGTNQIVPVIAAAPIVNNHVNHEFNRTDGYQIKWTNSKIAGIMATGLIMAAIGLLTKDLVPSELTILLVGLGTFMFSMAFLSVVSMLLISCTNKCYWLDNDYNESLNNPVHQDITPNISHDNMAIPSITQYSHSTLRGRVGFSLEIDGNSTRKLSTSSSPATTPESDDGYRRRAND